MAAFRNRLVHSYMDFDDSVLLSILQSDIDDIVEFAKAIDLKVLGVS
ncbi:MAG: HepT-like ribonuclease domain-containing protein [Candidatus Thorarchaeota archaeon]